MEPVTLGQGQLGGLPVARPPGVGADTLEARLPALLRTVAACETRDALLIAAAPELLALAGADRLLALRRRADGYDVVAAAGGQASSGEPAPVDVVAALADLVPDAHRMREMPVPSSWRDAGVTSALTRRLPGPGDLLVLAWSGAPAPEGTWGPALDAVLVGLARLVAEEALGDLTERVNNAQILANMGDYDWHIASDTNRWSDQLYRIYGHEPQSFNAAYERFLEHIHPDDRERIQGIHQQAYATGEPYQMIERIVRPSGELRYLSSNGQVVMGPDGAPQRMRGTCIDITDRVLAEQDRERSASRFRALVESSPDAIVVLDPGGKVVQSNGRAEHLLGGDPAGRRMAEVLAEPVRGHASAVPARGLDGRDLRLDVTSTTLGEEGGADGETAMFLHDALPRLANEALAASLHEARMRRRQALEINDNVVQGLSSALYASEQGHHDASTAYLERTLLAARRMMSDLLGMEGDTLTTGDLRRAKPASLEMPEQATAVSAETVAAAAAETEVRRILVVDDSEDIRMLLRLKLRTLEGCEVVGEAADGEEGVRLAGALQPHLVLLDLAMPTMDGLEALPLIREVAPDARVVVLSGFDEDVAASKALAAGAVKYVEKGRSMRELVAVVQDVLAEA